MQCRRRGGQGVGRVAVIRNKIRADVKREGMDYMREFKTLSTSTSTVGDAALTNGDVVQLLGCKRDVDGVLHEPVMTSVTDFTYEYRCLEAPSVRHVLHGEPTVSWAQGKLASSATVPVERRVGDYL